MDQDRRLLKDQPYDESLEVGDSEEVASVCSPTPSSRRQSETRRSLRGRGQMSANSDDFDDDLKAPKAEDPRPPGVSPHEEDEEEEEDEDSEEDSEDEDDDDTSRAPEGVYDPADYASLPVSTEIRELFQYITRYSPQSLDLDHSLKPFIPDFIPAVGDIDAFLKVPRPDGEVDGLGLVVLDEPSVKQSDPTVMSLWLSEDSKRHGAAELQRVSSVACPQSTPRQVQRWVDSISALHRSKPAASVHYGRAVPDIDALMQEWPHELEEQLSRVQLPPARLRCSPAHYADVICGLLDIPVHAGSRIQALHLLFSLYLEFRDSQHFRA
ncbi:uncharacterized protein V6R79_021117 [Siganus canaliculatus]